MDWDILDFVIFFGLLAMVAALLFFVVRKARNNAYRVGVGISVVGAFLLIWINGAVGIIGDENNDANMMFFGVLAVALAGAAIARLEARGMALASFATAAAQTLVAVIALLGGFGAEGNAWPWDVIVATLFFSGLWLTSAILFQRPGINWSSRTAPKYCPGTKVKEIYTTTDLLQRKSYGSAEKYSIGIDIRCLIFKLSAIVEAVVTGYIDIDAWQDLKVQAGSQCKKRFVFKTGIAIHDTHA